MPLSRFERFLPWTGLVAGLCWVGHWFLEKTAATDEAGAATPTFINDNLSLNYANQACLVLMGVALLFFATAVRNLLRSGEAREGTYSNIAYAGWVVVVAGISQMVAWGWALVNGAAAAQDEAAVHVLGYAHYFSWARIGVGLGFAIPQEMPDDVTRAYDQLVAAGYTSRLVTSRDEHSAAPSAH